MHNDLVKLANLQVDKPGRTLFVCQRCGEEVGDGEQDHNRHHQNCGGALDPNGEVPED
jgi:hypothetical protein